MPRRATASSHSKVFRSLATTTFWSASQTNPPGVSWGFSGAAAIDPAGRVAGVLTGAEFRDRMTMELGSILDVHQNGGVVSRPVILPGRSLVVIEPLRDPD